ncbi:DoxX family protein [Streptomyces sp. NBC_00687]|uniref:DoxX family protein n=1 Tax=Streptomyces sp. NBC_00687 TaxID=2975807 RepID=UPI002258C0E1|nr:DoxX family protein [Streptomyces sp. NBC_00687]MCX4919089.1 DoxX family protein [Streptomyces sp. NBC_00687]
MKPSTGMQRQEVALKAVLRVDVSIAAGAPKVQLKGDVPDGLVAKGLSSAKVRLVGLAEIVAAAGLVAGIWWQPLGIAAAVGMAVPFLSAIGYHVKWGDYGDSATRGAAMAPVLFALVAVAAAAILAASQ